MAKTRTQIKAMVQEYTKRGTEKAVVIENACDEALKIAIGLHPFKDAESEPTAIAITADAVSVSIAAITGLVHIVSARIIESTSNRYSVLKMQDRVWWDRNVVNPASNASGWPQYGLRYGTSIYFDRPAYAALSLKLRVVTDKTFTADATVCPVAVLDNFIVDYATYKVFAALENATSALFWRATALGPMFDRSDVPAGQRVGGSLMLAIESDRKDIAEEMQFNRDIAPDSGLAVENLDTGDTNIWY